MKRILLFLPFLTGVAFTFTSCWQPELYRDCVCFDEETHTKVYETIYDRKCSDLEYSKNRKAGYGRWSCENDTTSKKKNIMIENQ